MSLATSAMGRTIASCSLIASLAVPSVAGAAACLRDAFGSSVNCTANDVRITDVINVQVLDDGCASATDTVTFSGTLKVVTTAETRYDIGLFIGNDGEQALTGSCFVAALPTSPTPFVNADNDACGDSTSAKTLLVPTGSITMACVDDDDDGFAEVASCTSWQQNPGAACSGAAAVKPGSPSKCNCPDAGINIPIPVPEPEPSQCSDEFPCPDDGVACTDVVCDPDDEDADDFGCVIETVDSRCSDGLFCNGAEQCTEQGCQAGTPRNCGDGVACTADACNEANDSCTHTPNHSACGDSQFCNGTEQCTANGCTAGTPPACNDDNDCTSDTCSEADDSCKFVVDSEACDDQDDCTVDTCDEVAGCRHERVCDDICRSPGFWSTHSGFEKDAVNVGQDLIDAVGGLEVCGQSVTLSSNEESPFLDDLGMSSVLEGLCVRVQGERIRQLYRQLLAASLNCAISGAADCDDVVERYVDVSFSGCDALCSGEGDEDGPTMNECIAQLDCFNNGGQMIEGECAKGTCAVDTELLCGFDYPACPLIDDQRQRCRRFAGSCYRSDLCQEELNVCPDKTRASSPSACKEAKNNDCTIDSCE